MTRQDHESIDPDLDPGHLVREAYRIDNIQLAEARSIFLDWAIKLSPDLTPQIAIRRLLALYADQAPEDHPMTLVLKDGLGKLSGPARRSGGSRGRRGSSF